MREEWLKRLIIDNIAKSDLFAYSSQVEEALKLACFYEDRPLIIIKENTYLATKFYELIAPYFNENEVTLYLPEESLRAESIASSYENRAERIYALYSLLKKETKILVTTVYGYVRNLPNPAILNKYIKELKVGDILDRESLIDMLMQTGYERVNRVEIPLTFAVRGSIIDLFMVNYSEPLRIEFFDNEIDSIRFFDLKSQSTLKIVEKVELCFGGDIFFSQEEKNKLYEHIKDPVGATEIDLNYIRKNIYSPKLYIYTAYFDNYHIVDYLDKPLIYISNENASRDHLNFVEAENIDYLKEMILNKEINPVEGALMGDFDNLLVNQKVYKGQAFSQNVPDIIEIDLPYAGLNDLIKLILNKNDKYIVLALKAKEKEELCNILDKSNIDYFFFKDNLVAGINIIDIDLNAGFAFEAVKMTLYTGKELFGKKAPRGRFALKYSEAIILNSYDELKIGDYVVHNQYGIGLYLGIEQREVNHIRLDYLKIAYAGEDVLLVPLSQFSLVRKYVSREGVNPRLHKLGSKQWAKTKEKVEQDVNELAKRLVDLYSLRETKVGFAFSKDSILQKEFEDSFIYDLTPDQNKAIKEVKKDMEQAKPMDRLLCGDVGFGKTEVALRATFKAVNDHKQVAYLCPTTILSLQHYKTFMQRLMNYPVEVALINRFVATKQQKEIIQKLKDGKIDILIGTHRLLSNDVIFNDLGLLIVDEEQRFGVEHKEKIKELKNNIDVLSLSATPIPRTLQMSLIGIYGLSTLDTPPLNRYPVQTYVIEKNDNLVKEVIIRELARGGQVFYLYNDIDRLYTIAYKLEQDIPYAKIAVAHGKMSREEIEDVMLRFYEGDINVLICTTIIETGIDIPNANTILVENAENFGLSQLYQIKGRVGRSDRVAYAYFMVPPFKELNEKGRKRLEAIKEFTALGSGYKIAMRDLAIRGAGDLLGDRQSGFIDNVGLDLYLAMLNRAIENEKKGEIKKEEKINLNVPISSYIPENFSDNDYDKLDIYHHLDDIDNENELKKYEKELNDQYGHLPKEVAALFDKKRVELLIKNDEIENVRVTRGQFIITLSVKESDRLDGYKLFDYCNKLSKDIKINYTQRKLVLMCDNRHENVYKLISLSKSLKSLEKTDED